MTGVFWGVDYCLEWKPCSDNAIEKQLAFPMVVYDMLIIGSSLSSRSINQLSE